MPVQKHVQRSTNKHLQIMYRQDVFKMEVKYTCDLMKLDKTSILSIADLDSVPRWQAWIGRIIIEAVALTHQMMT